MGKRTGAGRPLSQPSTAKRGRSLVGVLWRVLLFGAIAFVLVFGAAAFYYSGEVRDGALEPPLSEDVAYALEMSAISGNRISILDTGNDDEIGEPGVMGVEWAEGYVQTIELVSSTEEDNGARVDVRVMMDDATPPSVGTAVRLDSYAFPQDPLQAFDIPFETVTYTSNLGSFPAWFIEGDSDTWAIIVHGKGAELAEGLRIIPILRSLGYPILVIHYRNDPGLARDPSGYHQFGVTEWVDLAAAVRYAERNGSTSHILVGNSMGGSIVTSYLTQSPLRNRTIAAILDSPTLRFESVVDFQASNTELPLIGVTLPTQLTTAAKWLVSWRFDVAWDDSDYLARSNELHSPMLIFHGRNDESVPFSTSQEMADLRPDIVTLVATDAGHMRSWNESPQDYEAAIIAFLDANTG